MNKKQFAAIEAWIDAKIAFPKLSLEDRQFFAVSLERKRAAALKALTQQSNTSGE
jgi:hypothetical protein